MATEKLYPHLYSAAARYLTPRWYGDEGEWERFADGVANRIGGVEGSAIYAHIASEMGGLYGAREFFAQTAVSWPRIKQAFIDRDTKYGQTPRSLNTLCLLAGGARDKKTTREMFALIGDDWDPAVWLERRYFDSYRAWAFRN
jgi:hypothetical protein